MEQKQEKATFAAGCFWGVEDTFRKIPGVIDVIVGYTGGQKANPTYEQVCTGTTGHAESVEVTFNPEKIPYDQLLDTFWNGHNPTTRNRQGPDVGSQYRSVIFYHNNQQRKAAGKSKEELEKSGKYTASVVTEIVPATTFYKAEEYHQQYYQKHGLTSCPI